MPVFWAWLPSVDRLCTNCSMWRICCSRSHSSRADLHKLARPPTLHSPLSSSAPMSCASCFNHINNMLCNADHPIPSNHSTSPVPNLSAISPQHRQPSSQQNAPLSSHVIRPPALASPLRSDAGPLATEPSSAAPTMHIHNPHIPQPILSHRLWDPTVSLPALQMFRPEVRVPNIEAGEGTANPYDHL
jgi:hypothetical protein